jgi:hypothetical protein
MATPIVFPPPTLPEFEVSFGRLFSEITAQVQYMRGRRQLVPLVPRNTILYGQEVLSELESAPSIAIVPRGFTYRHARETANETFDPRRLFSQWMMLECHCWGDDNSANPADNLYAFSTATELARELLVAMCDNNFGPHAVDVTGSEFIQKTDVNRQGRVLVLHVELETFVVRDSPLLIPSVTTLVTVGAQGADGTSTVAETTFTVP